MPELAEIETLKNYLENNIIGEEIQLFTAKRKNLRYALDTKNLQQHVPNTRITASQRIAKFWFCRSCCLAFCNDLILV